MKTTLRIFSFLFATALMMACASGESEMLKQARTIQDDMMKDIHALDSSLNNKITSLESDLSMMSEDSTMATDSVKLASYMKLKEKYNTATTLQSEMVDWKSNIKMLPTVEEMNGGAENPFGEKAKDQEVLAEMKKAQADLATMKTKVETAIKQ